MLYNDVLPPSLWEELLRLQAEYEDALAAVQAVELELAAADAQYRSEIAPFARVREAACQAASTRFQSARRKQGEPDLARLEVTFGLATFLAHSSYQLRTQQAGTRHSDRLREAAGKLEPLLATRNAALARLEERLDYAHGLLAAASSGVNGTALNTTPGGGATELVNATHPLATTSADGVTAVPS